MEMRTFWLVLITSNTCLRVKTQFGVRTEFRLGSGLGLGSGGLVGIIRVRARGWVIHNAYESPYKHTKMCVSVCVVNYHEEAHV